MKNGNKPDAFNLHSPFCPMHSSFLLPFGCRSSETALASLHPDDFEPEAAMSEFRIEKDSMGEVSVPAKAYYSAQTQRAVDNFPISGQPLPKKLIRALGLVKIAAA